MAPEISRVRYASLSSVGYAADQFHGPLGMQSTTSKQIMNNTAMNNGMADSNNLQESHSRTYNRSHISIWCIILSHSRIRRTPTTDTLIYHSLVLGNYNALNKRLLALSDLRHRAMHKDRDPTALRDGGRIGRHGKHRSLARLHLAKAVLESLQLFCMGCLSRHGAALELNLNRVPR